MRKLSYMALPTLEIALLLSFLFSLQVTAESTQTFTPPTQITVWIYKLNPTNGAIQDPPTLCKSGDTYYGCTAIQDPSYAYPYTTNPVTVSIESDYLLDVVPQEMSPGMFHPTAIQAQAIAARTYAYFHIYYNSTINNSANFQVFLPYKFESFSSASQQIISDATASRYYLTYYNQEAPARSEFFSDKLLHTDTHPQQNTLYPYLLGVEDPISILGPDITGCYGLSQYGASRWARGNTYGNINYTGVLWSVQWRRYEQILVHYYTAIYIRDANNPSRILTPDYRWNALSQIVPSPMYYQSYNTSIRVQNTSIYTWTSYYYISYRWRNLDGSPVSEPYTANKVPVALTPGADGTYVVSVQPPTLDRPRPLILQWDMRCDTPWPPNFWFSDYGWPTQDTAVCVGGPCRVFMPVLMKNYAGW